MDSDEADEAHIGDKKGARRQFRLDNLHIREYDDHYTVHRDKIDPRNDPMGHLLVDAPEYLASILSAVYIGKKVGNQVYKTRRAESKNQRTAFYDAAMLGYIAGSAAGMAAYIAISVIKKIKRSSSS
jgi:hypothetical protein